MTCWDTDEHHARARIVPGAVVVDLGASTGEFAIPAAAAGADVLCVEILGENVDALLRAGLRTRWAAAGGHDGHCRIVETGAAERATGCHVEADPNGALTMLSLATIVDDAGGHVDVLKVDIEGGEYDLFESAPRSTLEAIEYLAVEFHVWTVPGEARIEGLGERAGAPYPRGAADRLLAKLAETHDIDVDGIGGGLIWGALR